MFSLVKSIILVSFFSIIFSYDEGDELSPENVRNIHVSQEIMDESYMDDEFKKNTNHF